MKRKIIQIDEAKCTGCGLCVPNCAEGSLEIRDGKAVLVKEALCDGLGACLGHCPEGALVIEEREAEEFDEVLVEKRLEEIGREPQPHAAPAGGCPSAQVARIAPRGPTAPSREAPRPEMVSQLEQWPVQLTLLPPNAPFFKGADLMLTADCVPFAYPSFHDDFLKGNAIAVACPKLDNAGAHFQKLIQVFRQGGLRSVTVLRMDVPCCGGLSAIAAQAMGEAGADLPLREVTIGRDGAILAEKPLQAAAAA
jgi:Fe-S-cluster-containing hydrogenase component 2